MTVPFPRTVPGDAPQPPAPLLDQRAARVLFDAQKAQHNAVGYRLADEGVYVELPDAMAFYTWEDVKAFAHEQADSAERVAREADDADPDPSRRERRRQRRAERRGKR